MAICYDYYIVKNVNDNLYKTEKMKVCANKSRMLRNMKEVFDYFNDDDEFQDCQ